MHSENEVVYLHLDDIIPNRFQPREVFDDKALKELAVSIKEHGVIQPIIVRNIGSKYEIIAGERRYKASALAGLTKIPAIIRNLDDKESSKVALLENLQRRDLNPIEEARTYQKILELDEMTQEELAKTMGKSQSAVANKLRLLSLSEEVQQALLKEQISERHARTLLNISNPEEQKEMLNKVIASKMTVRELEQEIKKDNNPTEQTKEENTSSALENKNNMIVDSRIPLGEEVGDNTDMSSDNLENKETEEHEKIEEKPKFINYGEIDPDEENGSGDFSFGQEVSATAPADISFLKSNAQDINTPDKKVADLDSLLKIAPSNKEEDTISTSEEEPQESGFKFLAPAEEEEKKPAKEISPNATADINQFFGSAPVNNAIFGNSILENSNPQNEINTKISVQDAIEKIRESIKEIEKSGITIDSDEINFENSYQIVIKINKNNE